MATLQYDVEGEMIMKQLSVAIEQSANAWGVSKRLAWAIFWLPLIGALLVALVRISRPAFTFLTMEDGPLEWPQFLCFAAASIAGFAVALRRFRAGHYWQGLLFVGFGLATFFIAGEEIAWGQRIFGLQTPDELKAINHQGEITVHNIRWVQELLGVLLMFASGMAIVLPFASKRYEFGKRWDQGNFLFAPPLFTTMCFFAMFAYKLIRLIALRESEFTVTKYGEWPELCFAAGLAIFAYLNYRRLAAQPAPARAGTAGQTQAVK
jgi:hypothetical protein